MTNRKKDLFDLFREQQRQAGAAPSPRAWRKLEQRLDGHRRRNRLSTVRNLSMAAALLLITVIAVVLALAVERHDDGQRANAPLVAVEALQVDDAKTAEERRLTVSAQRAEARRRNTIQEGGRHQQLIPATIAGKPSANPQPSLLAASWLLGQWQSVKGEIIQWEQLGLHTLEGKIPCNEQQASCTARIKEVSGTLQLITDVGGLHEAAYALQQFNSRQLVFENTAVKFPKEIRLNRDGINSCLMIFCNPAAKDKASNKLSNKPMLWRLERLRLQ